RGARGRVLGGGSGDSGAADGRGDDVLEVEQIGGLSAGHHRTGGIVQDPGVAVAAARENDQQTAHRQHFGRDRGDVLGGSERGEGLGQQARDNQIHRLPAVVPAGGRVEAVAVQISDRGQSAGGVGFEDPQVASRSGGGPADQHH